MVIDSVTTAPGGTGPVGDKDALMARSAVRVCCEAALGPHAKTRAARTRAKPEWNFIAGSYGGRQKRRFRGASVVHRDENVRTGSLISDLSPDHRQTCLPHVARARG